MPLNSASSSASLRHLLVGDISSGEELLLLLSTTVDSLLVIYAHNTLHLTHLMTHRSILDRCGSLSCTQYSIQKYAGELIGMMVAYLFSRPKEGMLARDLKLQ